MIASAAIYMIALRYLGDTEFASYAFALSAVQWLNSIVSLSLGSYGVSLIVNADAPKGMAQALTRIRFYWGGIVALFTALALPIASGATVSFFVSCACAMVIVFRSLERDHYIVATRKASAYLLFRMVTAIVTLAGAVSFWWRPQWCSTPILLLLQAGSVLVAVWIQASTLQLPLFGGPVEGRVRLATLAPCGLATIATFFLMGSYNIDIFILRRFVEIAPEEIGRYAAVSKAVQFAVVPMSAAILSFAPALSEHWHNREHKAFFARHRKLVWATGGCGLAGAVVLVVVGEPLMSLVSQKNFAVMSQIFPAFALMYLLIGAAAPYVAILPYISRTGEYCAFYALCFLTCVIAQVVCIRKFGVTGAIYGLDAGLLVLFFVSSIAMHFKRRSPRWG